MTFEDLPLEHQLESRMALLNLTLRSWITPPAEHIQQGYQLQLEEFREVCEKNQLYDKVCQVLLLQVKFALTTMQFGEVESWLEQCLSIATEKGFQIYRQIAETEMGIFLLYKQHILSITKLDRPLSHEEQQEIYQEYLKQALESLEKDDFT